VTTAQGAGKVTATNALGEMVTVELETGVSVEFPLRDIKFEPNKGGVRPPRPERKAPNGQPERQPQPQGQRVEQRPEPSNAGQRPEPRNNGSSGTSDGAGNAGAAESSPPPAPPA